MARFLDQTTLIASAARTADNQSATVTTPDGANGIIVHIDATAITDTPSVVFTIQGYDATADDWYSVLASAAVTAVSHTTLTVGLGVATVANAQAGTVPPRKWRVDANHADTDSITYAVTYEVWS